MRLIRLVGFVFIIGSQIVCANAAQVGFQGKTTASMQLIQDATKNLITLGKSRYNCAAPDLIESEVLPPTYAADTHQAMTPSGKSTVYEKWDVTYCGQVESLLMIFMPQPRGGVTFGIQPFPGYGTARPVQLDQNQH
jgi:hypothetical protein